MPQPKFATLPAALATGLLAKRPLAHLLVYALHRKLTGSFELVDGVGEYARERAHIVVHLGMVSRVSTSTPIIYLGHMLYELGAIDAAQLSSSLAAVATTKRLHGQVLLAKGLIDREQLADALRQQRLRKLQHTFTMSPQTTFSFYPDVDLVGERQDDVEPMNPLPSVWRGIRAYPSWDHVRATIATVAGHPLRVIAPLDRTGLDDRERATAERMRQVPLTVSELVIRGRLDARAADLLVYFLVIAKLAELVEPVAVRPATASSAPRAAPVPVERPSERQLPVPAMPSGEYQRRISFTMRAVGVDTHPLRIPSPMPGTVSRSQLPRVDITGAPGAIGPSFADITAAEELLAEAEMRIVLGERGSAVTLVRKALAVAPELPAALACLAYLEALAATPGPDAYLHDLLRMVDAALIKDEGCRRGRFYRAEVKKRLGDHEGAIRDLRAAIRDDPDDVDANRELNTYERKVREGTVILRSPTGEVARPSGILKWLRGNRD